MPNRLLDWMFVRGVVEDVAEITARMRKIALAGPELGALARAGRGRLRCDRGG
jgi:hypothetical protein